MPDSEERSEASQQDQDDDQLGPYASTVFSASGVELADRVADFIDEYNAVPSTTGDPSTPTYKTKHSNRTRPEMSKNLDSGHAHHVQGCAATAAVAVPGCSPVGTRSLRPDASLQS